MIAALDPLVLLAVDAVDVGVLGANFALVVITGIYAFLTWRLAQSAEASVDAADRAAESAAESARLARRDLARSSMPIITVTSAGGGVRNWAVNVGNAGATVAMHVLIELYGETGDRVAYVSCPNLGAGESQKLSFGDSSPAAQALLGPPLSHRFEVLYTNAFGDEYYAKIRGYRESGHLVQEADYSYREHYAQEWSKL